MGEQMTFPNTWEEYEEFYGFTDSEQVYTNGARLIHSFRVEQWLDHKNVRGEWYYTANYGDRYNCGNRYRVCSKCKAGWKDGNLSDWNFCPNCGADMRGVK